MAHLWVWVWVWMGSGGLLQTQSWVWGEGEEEEAVGKEGPGPPAAPPQTGRLLGHRPVCPEDNSHTLAQALKLSSKFKSFKEHLQVSDSSAQAPPHLLLSMKHFLFCDAEMIHTCWTRNGMMCSKYSG